jgi:hypothetical protein
MWPTHGIISVCSRRCLVADTRRNSSNSAQQAQLRQLCIPCTAKTCVASHNGSGLLDTRPQHPFSWYSNTTFMGSPGGRCRSAHHRTSQSAAPAQTEQAGGQGAGPMQTHSGTQSSDKIHRIEAVKWAGFKLVGHSWRISDTRLRGLQHSSNLASIPGTASPAQTPPALQTLPACPTPPASPSHCPTGTCTAPKPLPILQTLPASLH